MLNKRTVNLLFTLTRRYSQHAKNQELVVEYLKGDHAGIAVIGMNRPQQKNAISIRLLEHLNKAVDKMTSENLARVLIIRSIVPGSFCAGADLKERAVMSSKEVQNAVTNIRNFVNKMFNIPFPVITALDGVTLGGGLEIALASDIRVATTNAKMGLVETKLGIMPGAGGTQLLPRVINPSVAKELIFTAKILDGNQAKELGLVNHVVEQNENGDAAYVKCLEIAEEILPNGPLGIRMAKQAINRGVEVDFSTGLAIEDGCYSQLIHTKDRTEGLEAFKEKRKPVYLGGGLEIALASDIRVATTNAKMGLVETKLGIMPGAGGTQLLPRVINPSVAKELIFTAKILDGNQAKELGLVNHVVEQNENGDAAYVKCLEIAEEILPNGPLGIRMAKQAINRGVEVDFSTGLAIEDGCYSQLIHTKDRTEGLEAFKEKRKPVYLGQ